RKVVSLISRRQAWRMLTPSRNRAVNEIVQDTPKPAGRAGQGPKTTCRMFENELLEKFSRIHPATPFVVYVPVILAMAYRTYARDVELLTAAGMCLGGILVWTLTEYFLH